jgi:acyl carrier protein
MSADKVHAIWCREFQRNDISPDDNFFTLGGHSLIMARIQSAFMGELGVEVSMEELFLNPTIASISAHLASAKTAPGLEPAG